MFSKIHRMQVKISWQTQTYLVALNQPIDISIPMQNGNANPNAFHIPHPRFDPIQIGDFIGAVAAGSSANCENLFINPHGNGTHTECVGHITSERITIHQTLNNFHFLAQIITLPTSADLNGNKWVTAPGIASIIESGVEALVIRTLPNAPTKLTANYSGNFPAYLDPHLCKAFAAIGIKHLLLDLPSVDPESDNGLMLAHKAFWNYPESPRLDCTITEMVYVPEQVPDGKYLLNLQIASIQSDASPSKPVLYALI